MRAALSACEDVKIVGEATCTAEAVKKVEKLRPDIIIMEALMPYLDEPEASLYTNGIEATYHLKQMDPKVKVIIFTVLSGREIIRPLLRVGISAYVSKKGPMVDLCRAVQVVIKGGNYFSEDPLNHVSDKADDTMPPLSVSKSNVPH
jgi:DNA-binding NarL/FixJ family response regulator